MQEDSDEFLSLEVDESLESVPKKVPKPAKTVVPESILIDAEIIDMSVVEEHGGKYTLSWPIEDMDCPDCAYKAMNALNRLPQVDKSTVSATEGTVTLDINFEMGSTSEASAILKSLGKTAPTFAKGTLIPNRVLGAPHTT